MTADRRRYIRFDVPLDVIYRPTQKDVHYRAAVTRNFSREGCCIELTHNDIDLFETLDLLVKHPGKNIFVSASGDVVWKYEKDSSCSIGVKLLNMDKEAKSEILDFAYDIWLEKNLQAEPTHPVSIEKQL